MKKGVNVAILDDLGHVLVLKRSPTDHFYPSFWNLPGGKIEGKEDLIQGARREVKEETGLDVELVQDYFDVYYYPSGKIENAESAVYAFRAKSFTGEMKLDDEHIEAKWVANNDWQKLECTPSCASALQKLFG